MGVHKSQGSEFDEVAVLLPKQASPVVSRELLYTAVTRARHSVTVHATREVIEHAITHRIERASGLRDRCGSKIAAIFFSVLVDPQLLQTQQYWGITVSPHVIGGCLTFNVARRMRNILYGGRASGERYARALDSTVQGSPPSAAARAPIPTLPTNVASSLNEQP
jgi:hypothetical protein